MYYEAFVLVYAFLGTTCDVGAVSSDISICGSVDNHGSILLSILQTDNCNKTSLAFDLFGALPVNLGLWRDRGILIGKNAHLDLVAPFEINNCHKYPSIECNDPTLSPDGSRLIMTDPEDATIESPHCIKLIDLKKSCNPADIEVKVPLDQGFLYTVNPPFVWRQDSEAVAAIVAGQNPDYDKLYRFGLFVTLMNEASMGHFYRFDLEQIRSNVPYDGEIRWPHFKGVEWRDNAVLEIKLEPNGNIRFYRSTQFEVDLNRKDLSLVATR